MSQYKGLNTCATEPTNLANNYSQTRKTLLLVWTRITRVQCDLVHLLIHHEPTKNTCQLSSTLASGRAIGGVTCDPGSERVKHDGVLNTSQ